MTNFFKNYIKYFLSPVNLGLIFVNFFVYWLLVIFTLSKTDNSLSDVFVSGPVFSDQNLLLLQNVFVDRGQIYRFITATFVHFDLNHVSSNMFALFIFGPLVERILGHRNYLIFYLSAGVFGNMVSYLFLKEATAGASGAIFGVIGLFVILLWTIRKQVDLKLRVIILVIIISTLYFDIYQSIASQINLNNLILNGEIQQESQTNIAAHIGGFISSFLIGIPLIPNIKSSIRIYLSFIDAIFVVLILGATLFEY
jgi:rhomboid protease GluP